MKRILIGLAICICGLWHNTVQADELLVFAGSASKPVLEVAADGFKQKTGVTVRLIMGGSGAVLNQMQLTQKGDIYFPGSSDFMEIAKTKKLVIPQTETKIFYLVPMICVAKGNPKHIQSLSDLTRSDIRFGMANPETVCLGIYAVELLVKNLSRKNLEIVKKNIATYTTSCDQTASVLAMGTVDAIIGWDVFHHWNPEKIESVPLPLNQLSRIGYIPAAISIFSQQRELAQSFLNYIRQDPEMVNVCRRLHYQTTTQSAFKIAGGALPVGGDYYLPKDWTVQP